VKEKVCRSCRRLLPAEQFSLGQASCKTCRAKRAREKYQEGRQRKSDNSDQNPRQTEVSSEEESDELSELEYLQYEYEVLRHSHQHLVEHYNKIHALNQRMKKVLDAYGERVE
jgi:hypothetical protein